MMSRNKLLAIAIVAMLLLNMGLLSFILLDRKGQNHGPVGEPMHPGERPREIIIDRLRFTDRQVKAYDELIQAHRDAIRQKEQEIGSLKSALYLSLRAGAAMPQAVKDSLIQKLGEVQQSIEWAHYHHFEEIGKLCTIQQRADFDKLSAGLAQIFARPAPPPRP